MNQSDKLKFYLEHNRNVLLVGPHGCGKCLGKGTPVLMFNGTVKNVENIKVGDLIMGPDSSPRKILSLARGIEEMYKIIPKKGEPFICNGSHILSLKHTEKDGIIDISVNDFLKKSNYFKSRCMLFRTGVEFSNNEKLEESPYLLGLWLGDGSKYGPVITNTDQEIINYIYNYASTNNLSISKNDISYRISSNQKAKKIAGRNTFLNFLNKNNLIKNKHIPQSYLTSSIENRRELLAGIIDSDGYLYNNCVNIIQKCKKLSEDILFLSRSIGLAAYIKTCIKGCWYKGEYKKGLYYRISISGDICKIPCLLARKQATKNLSNRNQLHTSIKEIIPIGEDNYYGFTIDGDHRFLLGDFTVTHNTETVKQVFNEAGLKWKYFSGPTMDPWINFVGVPKEKNGKLEFILPSDFSDDSVEAIFIDELNRSHAQIRNAVMELIQFKSINGRKFNNIKVVWAAINPQNDDEYDVEKLDPALQDRFHAQIYFKNEPNVEYFTKKYGTQGVRACDWWNTLYAEQKKQVSPRRLDYAIELLNINGDIHDIFPETINCSSFVKTLNTGSSFEQFMSLEDSQKKTFVNTNFDSLCNLIKVNETIANKISIYFSDERIQSLISKHDQDNSILVNCLKSFYTNKDYTVLNYFLSKSDKQSQRILFNTIKYHVLPDPKKYNFIQTNSISMNFDKYTITSGSYESLLNQIKTIDSKLNPHIRAKNTINVILQNIIQDNDIIYDQQYISALINILSLFSYKLVEEYTADTAVALINKLVKNKKDFLQNPSNREIFCKLCYANKLESIDYD